jgi:tetratricopeptide (TPR) repeat protein
MAIVVAINQPTWDYGFVYDDNAVIVNRPSVFEQGWGKFFETRQWGTGRHAVTLSFDLNRTDPLAPRPFHVVNTALAALATVLVFSLGVALGLSTPAAFVAGALFAVHPVHTDAVVSIIGRAEVLAGIAVLGCMLLHVRGYPEPGVTLPAAALLFLIGASSKESALALPALLVLYDFLLGARRSLGKLLVPYAAYGVAVLAWAGLAAHNFGTLDPIAYVDNPIAFLPAYERIPRAAAVLWRYLGLVVLPISLKPDRSFATTMPTMVEGVVGVLAWLVLLVACWRARTRYPREVFFTLWFPASFIVTANVVYPVAIIMAERLLFTPSVGLTLLAGAIVERVLAGTWARRATVTALVTVSTLALAFAYDMRARVWANDAHYHLVAAFESPSSAKAHYNLGLERARAKDYDAAEAAFRRALEIYPGFGLASYYLAGVYIETDRPDAAITVYRGYLEHEPNDVGALSQLVTLLASADQYEEAHTLAERLVQLDPENEGYRSLLVMVEQLAEGGTPDPSVLEGQLEQGQAEPPH